MGGGTGIPPPSSHSPRLINGSTCVIICVHYNRGEKSDYRLIWQFYIISTCTHTSLCWGQVWGRGFNGPPSSPPPQPKILYESLLSTHMMHVAVMWLFSLPQVKELTCDTYKSRFMLKELPRGKAIVQNMFLVSDTCTSTYYTISNTGYVSVMYCTSCMYMYIHVHILLFFLSH